MKTKLLSLFFAVNLFTSCTENEMAKNFGGTMTVELPPNTEFVTATWKEQELWYIYRPRAAGETIDTVIMQEVSNLGLIEGTVKFNEH